LSFSVDNIILILAVLLTIGVLTAKFSSRLGLPSLVFFIVVGMVLSNYIYFDNAKLAQLFGIIALVIIIFDGGLQTKWVDVRRIIVPSSMLATIGVFITTIIIGLFSKLNLDLK
jgi:cell volume regulation protein A